jgi:hypothetical protein
MRALKLAPRRQLKDAAWRLKSETSLPYGGCGGMERLPDPAEDPAYHAYPGELMMRVCGGAAND